ncbi:beta-ketoacyl synthase N-terminal-like domain-containing protein [Streptomyces catenulae]|uniref:Beta-ketoacyl synthase N-terminal-like domain-containing protein n=1 Tax=Streptomyces catenulae TaxID=66875 RepID=A0ABV2Z3W0_9ACTN|nr:beta-ketoacyl synthase N-terminal-like domain-containing protein [Streptomyces catenulae]
MSPLVLSAWSAVSPYGVGAEPFARGITAGRCAVGPLDPATHPGPFDRGGVVPDFSARTHVGKKGTRTMDRVTALAVAAVGQLLESCDGGPVRQPEETALVLGTGSGSVQSIMDFTRDSFAGERPYHVDPARFPNAVMNRAAGQSAIWHRIKGPNTTVAGGWLTGLLALSYAARLHRGGHCARVLCGAAEEYSEQRAWLEWHGRSAAERATPLGEGGAVFLLEPAEAAREAGHPALARLLTTRFRAYGAESEVRAALAACVRDALKTTGVAPGDVRLVAPLGAGGESAALEEAGVGDALGAADPRWIRCRPLLGDTSAAATSLQLAAVLAAAGADGLAPGEAALVTGVERDGTVGCALLAGA